jgi:hypothetical protein
MLFVDTGKWLKCRYTKEKKMLTCRYTFWQSTGSRDVMRPGRPTRCGYLRGRGGGEERERRRERGRRGWVRDSDSDSDRERGGGGERERERETERENLSGNQERYSHVGGPKESPASASPNTPLPH